MISQSGVFERELLPATSITAGLLLPQESVLWKMPKIESCFCRMLFKLPERCAAECATREPIVTTRRRDVSAQPLPVRIFETGEFLVFERHLKSSNPFLSDSSFVRAVAIKQTKQITRGWPNGLQMTYLDAAERVPTAIMCNGAA